MKKRYWILPLLLMCLGAALVGLWWFGRSESGQTPAEGKTAVLFSSLAEMWQDAGGRVDITVGESVERGFVTEDIPLVDDGAGKTVNIELLLSYQPSLVIYSADIPAQAEAAAILEQQGIPTLGCKVESFADYERVMKEMCALTGDKTALKTVQELRTRIDAVCKEKPFEGKNILFIRAGSSAASTKAKQAEDHFACAMLEEMGAENIADAAPVLLDGLSMEAILKADPDYIFFSLMGKESAARENVEHLLKEDTWSALSAVKAGRAYILPKELFHFKPGSRWGEAYSYLKELA